MILKSITKHINYFNLQSTSRYFKTILGDLTRQAIILFLLYLLFAFTYRVFTGISVERYTDGQIENLIRSNINDPQTLVKVFKKDLKGFGNESIIIFTGLPLSGDHNYGDDVSYKDYPKIIIFDQIQKNSIEDLLFRGNLYHKAFDIQLIENIDNDTGKLEWNPGYELVGAYEAGRGIVFKRIDLLCGSSCIQYFGVITYSINEGYIISPLFDSNIETVKIRESLTCYKQNVPQEEVSGDEQEYQDCLDKRIPLEFNNSYISVNINKESTVINLTSIISDNPVIIDGEKLHFYQNLWFYSDNENEAHMDSHDYIGLDFKFNGMNFKRDYTAPYQFYSKENGLLDSYDIFQ